MKRILVLPLIALVALAVSAQQPESPAADAADPAAPAAPAPAPTQNAFERFRAQQQMRNRSGRPSGASRNRPSASYQNRPPVPPPNRPSAAPPAGGAPAADSGEAPAFNWDAAPVDLVFQTYSERVKKTILRDPGCPTPTITLKSLPGQKLTDEEFLEAIETVLEMNQIHLEPYGESFIRALPRKDVRREGIPLIMDPDTKIGETGKVISMMIPFKNITTEEAQKALEGFKSASGILLVFERTNSILVTDTEANINRMLEIARSIDVATPVLENVFVRQIKNASAEDIKTALDAIVTESQKELEKNGKTPQNQMRQNQNNPMMRNPLLRPRNQKEQQPAVVNNESLVMSVSDADRGMIRGKVLILADERSNKLIIVTMKSNMDFFDKVIEQLDVETTPDTVVKVYRLKYAEAEDVSDMINDLIGNSQSSKNSGKANQNQNSKQGSGANMTTGRTQTQAKKPANQRTGDSKAGELSKENTTVLADKRINGIVVMTDKELVPTIEQIIESMDIKLSQVLIETCIIEVSLGDGLNTGVDWVQLGRKQTDGTRNLGTFSYQKAGKPVALSDAEMALTDDDKRAQGFFKEGNSWFKNTYEWVENTMPWSNLEKGKLWNGSDAGQYMLGGGGGAGSALLNTMLNVGTNLVDVTPAGSGLNWFMKSEALNIGAVIQASKTDSRSKYIASPIIMTLDNKEATIEATQSRKFYSGSTASAQYGGNSTTYNYSDKDIGIKIKVTPKINPNGTVMLTVEEEYSQLGEKQEVLVGGSGGAASKEQIDTALQRKMSSDALLENGQTVIFGGLTQTRTAESETGIPILKDIPWIGKWLFGSVEQTESRNELLVFMTPYVLDDASSAQAEAIRRKKALSDPRAWDDHGWSASALADPVSKKEMMRRLQDEWKIQDEERKTKIAIEKAKVDRAKALKNLSKEERKLWLDMHKDELDKEHQEELEKKMLDKESQDELKKLAEDVRAKKLAEAKVELDKMEEMTRAENERSRLDAEKAKRKEEAEDGAAGGGDAK